MCRPSSYRISAPSTDPAVAARTAPAMFIRVYVVINPPKVKITSDGIGGNKFSIRIRANIPAYPYELKSSSTISRMIYRTPRYFHIFYLFYAKRKKSRHLIFIFHARILIKPRESSHPPLPLCPKILSTRTH